MNRREFLQVGAASSGLILSGTADPASAASRAIGSSAFRERGTLTEMV
jgi:hypothetical protein